MAASSGPSGSGPAAPNANDCLAFLSSAVSATTEQDRRRPLSQLLALLEGNPGLVTMLYQTFVGMLAGPVGGRGVVRRWVAEVMELAICRGPLHPDQKTQLSLQSMDPLLKLMTTNDPSDPLLSDTKKFAIQVLASAYPLIFRFLLANPSSAPASNAWSIAQQLKAIVLALWRSEPAPLGIRIAATKLIQRVVQLGSKMAVDPRRRGDDRDPHVGFIPASHPLLRAKDLENEGTALLEETVRLLYSARNPDLVSAVITVLGFLVRARPSHGNLIITALTSWSPISISASTPSPSSNLTYTLTRGPEKTLRITLFVLERISSSGSSPLSSFTNQLREAINVQGQRMDKASEAARWERDRLANLKRQQIQDEVTAAEEAKKRVKLDHQPRQQALNGGTGTLPGFDVTTLPVELVVELIVANFQVLSDQALQAAILRARPAAPAADDEDAIERLEFKQESEAMLDGKLGAGRAPEGDLAEDDEEDEAAAAEADPEGFVLPPPERLSEEQRSELLRTTLERIAETGMERMQGRMGAAKQGGLGEEIWVATLVRLATRGLVSESKEERDVEREEEEETRREQVRQVIFEFIVADLQNRLDFGRIWLNEEWYGTRAGSPPLGSLDQDRPYNRWLRKLVDHIVAHPSTDRAFGTFLVDLPEVPVPEIRRLEGMCTSAELRQDGFTTLRDLALLRPPARIEAMDVLLGLTTHSEKTTRNAAIVLARSWVPDTQPLAGMVIAFARHLLTRLQTVVDETPAEPAKKEEGMELEAGEEAPEEATCAVVESGVVTGGLPPARSQESVRQHLELLFGLSMKAPDMLDDLFASYGGMPAHVQDAIQVLVLPLISALGARHVKITSLIETCPAGSDELVLKVIGILTGKARAPPQLVEAVKALASSREDLPPKFLVPIVADLSKADIVQYLPRVLGVLDGTPAGKATVRGIFETIVEPPPQDFGAASTNAPRTRQSDLLTPVELMAVLHRSEVPLKQSIEAIGICFSMTDVFRPEVLAAFMQQVVDELTLPTLFLRTVIQAVQTYKSLQGFVSTTLLSRLIIKKIWTQPQLWEGFIRCAKTVAPHSFGALLQLPRDQLREVMAKQPALRAPLREYVVKKAGANKSRVATMLEILSDQPHPPDVANGIHAAA